VLLFEGPRRAGVGFQVGVYVSLVGVIVGERGVNLCQAQVAKLACNLFRNQLRVVSLGDPSDGYTGPRNTGAPAANAGLSRDQAADLG